MFSGEKFSDAKNKASPLNLQFVDLMDFLTKAFAGLPAGYRHFSLEESRKFELALRWKERYLSYSGEFSLCAQDNLKELLPLVNELQDGPQREKILAKLDIASKTVTQSVSVHDALIANHVYLAGHAEVSRRDSYLKQLHNIVKPERKKDLRAAPLAQSFTLS